MIVNRECEMSVLLKCNCQLGNYMGWIAIQPICDPYEIITKLYGLDRKRAMDFGVLLWCCKSHG